MFGLGFSELLVIAVVLLVAIGPERLPEFMRKAGQMYSQVRRASDELRRAFVLEADRMDADERYQKLQERRAAAEEARKKAAAATGGVVHEPKMEPAAALPGPAADGSPTDGTPKPYVNDDPYAAAPVPTLPSGVSSSDWNKLPPHIRAMLMQVPKPKPEGTP